VAWPGEGEQLTEPWRGVARSWRFLFAVIVRGCGWGFTLYFWRVAALIVTLTMMMKLRGVLGGHGVGFVNLAF
jgi:hypothetical protein